MVARLIARDMEREEEGESERGRLSERCVCERESEINGYNSDGKRERERKQGDSFFSGYLPDQHGKDLVPNEKLNPLLMSRLKRE